MRTLFFILLAVIVVLTLRDTLFTQTTQESSPEKEPQPTVHEQGEPQPEYEELNITQTDDDNETIYETMVVANDLNDTNITVAPLKPKPKQKSLEESIEILGAQAGDPIFIRIFKQESELEMWMKHDKTFHLIQTYPICSYSGNLGPKLKEGDMQSPEGFYHVTKGRLNPNSKFHLSFNIGYPNRYDRSHDRTGSFIMVHGSCVSIGCYAMTDTKIEEIYGLVESAFEKRQRSVRVHVFPFRMSKTAMAHYRNHEWYSFWKNLKEGYDLFESSQIPPNVKSKAKRYIFK